MLYKEDEGVVQYCKEQMGVSGVMLNKEDEGVKPMGSSLLPRRFSGLEVLWALRGSKRKC